EIFLGECETKQAADLAVDDPVSPLGLVSGIEQQRTELAFRRSEVIPGLRALNHMGICVYPSHELSSANDFGFSMVRPCSPQVLDFRLRQNLVRSLGSSASCLPPQCSTAVD